VTLKNNEILELRRVAGNAEAELEVCIFLHTAFFVSRYNSFTNFNILVHIYLFFFVAIQKNERD
jgi:hypothetical protein